MRYRIEYDNGTYDEVSAKSREHALAIAERSAMFSRPQKALRSTRKPRKRRQDVPNRWGWTW